MLDPFKLSTANSSADVGHSIIKANHVVPILAVLGEPLAFEVDGTLMDGRILCDHHSALARGDRLVAEKAKGCDVPKRADVAALVIGPDRFRAVLHN